MHVWHTLRGTYACVAYNGRHACKCGIQVCRLYKCGLRSATHMQRCTRSVKAMHLWLLCVAHSHTWHRWHACKCGKQSEAGLAYGMWLLGKCRVRRVTAMHVWHTRSGTQASVAHSGRGDACTCDVRERGLLSICSCCK